MKKRRLPGNSGSNIASVFLGCCLLSSCALTTDRRKPLEYGEPHQIGVVTDERINEASGLALANETSDAFWTHNDSGDGPFIYLINKKGETLGSRQIEGASARDWEDIATFKRENESLILVADVGDNPSLRQEYQLYLVKEPAYDSEDWSDDPLEIYKTIRFQYEDGAHNCESVGIDPIEDKIFLVSKMQGDTCKVYQLPLTFHLNEEILTARAIATLEIPTTVGMDISVDGKRAIILTYQEAYEYTRQKGESWADCFSRNPRILQMPPRICGEAISYGRDGESLYLVSENIGQPLWEVKAK